MESARREFTQKVAILREHLIEHVPVSDLCDKHKLHPTLFYQWQKAFFENGAAAFESRRPCSQSLSKEEDKIAALEGKLRNKTEVLAEVVEELVRTKKPWAELSGRWVARDTRDIVTDFIKRLSARTAISPLYLVDWMELSRSKYYQWKDRTAEAGTVLLARQSIRRIWFTRPVGRSSEPHGNHRTFGSFLEMNGRAS